MTVTELVARLLMLGPEWQEKDVRLSIFFQGLGERDAPLEDIATSERTGVHLIYEGET